MDNTIKLTNEEKEILLENKYAEIEYYNTHKEEFKKYYYEFIDEHLTL